MKRILTLLIFLAAYPQTRAQTQDCSVLLNHFLIVVDSTTYQAILGSEILNSDFAYGHEKKLKSYSGIYVFGQDNYIEIFHPKSYLGANLTVGYTWICHSSLIPNCIEHYEVTKHNFMAYTTDENYDDLSVYTQDSMYYSQDSSSLMTTWELNKIQYESWTKKTLTDSTIFETTDYNSPADSDSSKHYLFNNVKGIQVNLNNRDSLNITQYLNLIGYTLESNIEGKLKFSNAIDFIELDFSKHVEFASIAAIYFELAKPTTKQFTIGNTEIILAGNTGKWLIK